MIFAFLFGLSMDYEVFMLTRMREAYDETGDTRQAIALGLARTGKLVTSAALILMFAFFVLSSSPGRRHQAVRDRPRRRDHLRRDGHPRAARAGDHAPARPLELVAPAGGRPAPAASARACPAEQRAVRRCSVSSWWATEIGGVGRQPSAAGWAGSLPAGQELLELSDDLEERGQAAARSGGRRSRSLVRKPWAIETSVTWWCQPGQERPSKWSRPSASLSSR